MKSSVQTKFMGGGLLAAVLASVCCIAPLLAIVGGAAGALSAFDWLEPLRPYLIGLTVILLSAAWYQRLKPAKTAADCACEDDDKPSLVKSNKFLLMVSVMALLFLSFPYYADAFYKQPAKSSMVQTGFQQTVQLEVKGMTCSGCEAHVNQEVGKLPGVSGVNTSYKAGSATVTYDSTKVKPQQLVEAARKTGYKVSVKGKE
ncbi:mercuric transport protein MerTP [Pontibacter sp. E15-1]|uniref:mercuric transport protein MerTP n=1 Tax=Pontibacter sp. E15-1 TaxID=2919918 RepID=UPI001F4F2440|nr:mercuric transport protein MerTP [Pontibacter sp. E15-1]MCJ8163216.1 mercuric transport protein MerTP [Pontibacter sp. E15-1]